MRRERKRRARRCETKNGTCLFRTVVFNIAIRDLALRSNDQTCLLFSIIVGEENYLGPFNFSLLLLPRYFSDVCWVLYYLFSHHSFRHLSDSILSLAFFVIFFSVSVEFYFDFFYFMLSLIFLLSFRYLLNFILIFVEVFRYLSFSCYFFRYPLNFISFLGLFLNRARSVYSIQENAGKWIKDERSGESGVCGN